MGGTNGSRSPEKGVNGAPLNADGIFVEYNEDVFSEDVRGEKRKFRSFQFRLFATAFSYDIEPVLPQPHIGPRAGH